MTTTELIQEVIDKILTGGRRTTAKSVREILTEIFESYPNVEDGGNVFVVPVGYSTDLAITDDLSFVHKKWVLDNVGSNSTLSEVLANGNDTDGNNIKISGFDLIHGETEDFFIKFNNGSNLVLGYENGLDELLLSITSSKFQFFANNGTDSSGATITSNSGVFYSSQEVVLDAPFISIESSGSKAILRSHTINKSQIDFGVSGDEFNFTNDGGGFGDAFIVAKSSQVALYNLFGQYSIDSAGNYITHGSKIDITSPIVNIINGSEFFTSNFGIDSIATGGTDVLNIGATNANVINYGNSSTIHNFLGTAIYELQVNSYVTDKLMTLNYGSSAASGIGVGYEIEENSIITGYQKTNAARSGWSFKAPANTDYTDFVFSASVPRTKTFQDSTSTIAEYANKLSVFAATTSAEFAGVISDETGFASGALLVFSKSPTIDAPTFSTSVNASYATALRLAIFDAAKNLISADTTTYPDLTELAWLKGVSSQLRGQSDTATLTNKRITPRVTSIVSSGTPTVNSDNCDAVDITALAAAITSMTTNLSGTPTNFQRLVFRIKDNGTARAITWGASFEALGVALPTTTTINKRLTVGFIWDSTTSKWGCVAALVEA